MLGVVVRFGRDRVDSGTRMLYTFLLEVYVEDVNLRLDEAIREKWRIIG
jgi:hypothetical protein